MIDLSVVIPCHNEAATLGAQLDALAAEEWDGSWEVIVVDNASTDGTPELASNHAGLAGRLRVVRATDGRGVAFARRAGVLASRGGSVAFCDGDDVIARGWVSAMGAALRSHPLVTGDVELARLNSSAVARSRGDRAPGSPPVYAGMVFLRGNNGGLERAVWDQLGGFDESFHGLEDIELTLRAAAAGLQVHFEPGAVVHYRYRSGLRALFRQGLFYGGSYPLLRRRCLDLGLTPPARFAWRSWAALARDLPLVWRDDVRARWVWTFACRVGALRSALREVIP